MGFAPAPASRKILEKTGLKISNIDFIELNEAFAAQALAVTRDLGLPDDAEHVNPNGGAIAIGHPLGASGARLITTAISQIQSKQVQATAVLGRERSASLPGVATAQEEGLKDFEVYS